MTVSLFFPSQAFPPRGAGLVQVRMRVLVPPLHVFEQEPKLPHVLQAPFTEKGDL